MRNNTKRYRVHISVVYVMKITLFVLKNNGQALKSDSDAKKIDYTTAFCIGACID